MADEKDAIRVGLRLSGPLLASIREVRDLVGAADEAAAARYLVSRGIEAMADKIRAKKLLDKVEAQYSPQEMLSFMQENGYVPAEDIK